MSFSVTVMAPGHTDNTPGKRLSTNECKATTKNRHESVCLSKKLNILEKEKELHENKHTKSMISLRQSMESFKITTGKTQDPYEKLKIEKPILALPNPLKSKTERSDSLASFNFNYDLIHKQAAENNGMLYNAFPFKSLQDPMYQFNPTFVKVSETPESRSRRISVDRQKDNEQSHDYDDSSTMDDESIFANNEKFELIEVNNDGFKLNLEEEAEEQEELLMANRLKRAKKKFEKETNMQLDDEKLEQEIQEIYKQRMAIPHIDPKKIEQLKNKDPIFAKRYRQFASARLSGRAPLYELQDSKIRLAMPRSAIEKKKKEMLQVFIETKKPVIKNPEIEVQQKLNEKLRGFTKNLSSNWYLK